MSFIFDLIKDILISILIWLILFPVVMVFATPVILTLSVFGKNGRYPERIVNGYGCVFGFWLDYGLWCLPWGAPN